MLSILPLEELIDLSVIKTLINFILLSLNILEVLLKVSLEDWLCQLSTIVSLVKKTISFLTLSPQPLASA